ncbi:hypothetical protein O181_016162 [Austropuccinia psidii MF-1]|uniref:Uncharacterized protein n=1 Tax=Austropuccinia psidii MF-1 TaxID=1389203 RepID=A0A9Q3C522_9BASI|nr:hypothetical protein [Austropuccinia psidii MF-1]
MPFHLRFYHEASPSVSLKNCWKSSLRHKPSSSILRLQLNSEITCPLQSLPLHLACDCAASFEPTPTYGGDAFILLNVSCWLSIFVKRSSPTEN